VSLDAEGDKEMYYHSSPHKLQLSSVGLGHRHRWTSSDHPIIPLYPFEQLE
jgi:hypothetical protein